MMQDDASYVSYGKVRCTRWNDFTTANPVNSDFGNCAVGTLAQQFMTWRIVVQTDLMMPLSSMSEHQRKNTPNRLEAIATRLEAIIGAPGCTAEAEVHRCMFGQGGKMEGMHRRMGRDSPSSTLSHGAMQSCWQGCEMM